MYAKTIRSVSFPLAWQKAVEFVSKKNKKKNPKNCDFCGKELPSSAEKDVDPLCSQIHGDYTKFYICEKCYEERQEEV